MITIFKKISIKVVNIKWLCGCYHVDVNEVLYKWHIMRKQSVSVLKKGPILPCQTEKLPKELGGDTFM